MTPEFVQVFARDVCVWGWPIVNVFHRAGAVSNRT
jgi:hypothetical protein